jgi:hypothetical protein
MNRIETSAYNEIEICEPERGVCADDGIAIQFIDRRQKIYTRRFANTYRNRLIEAHSQMTTNEITWLCFVRAEVIN